MRKVADRADSFPKGALEGFLSSKMTLDGCGKVGEAIALGDDVRRDSSSCGQTT
jgi:hypothetical protein